MSQSNVYNHTGKNTEKMYYSKAQLLWRVYNNILNAKNVAPLKLLLKNKKRMNPSKVIYYNYFS